MNREKVTSDSLTTLIDYCCTHLDFSNIPLPDDKKYAHLPLCVIDAVFSIGVNYRSTLNTVSRFCQFYGIQQVFSEIPLEPQTQISIIDFLEFYAEEGIEEMTSRVFQNRQRTSSTSGILKAEAVLMFSQTLAQFEINYLQDVEQIIGIEAFESEIKAIPGQGSGISLSYFYMLLGEEDVIKPDRMINRFVQQATGETYDSDEIIRLITAACAVLTMEYPGLTPRMMDHLIWFYQRGV